MNPVAKLTRRENEVARLSAWGAAKKEIARMLFIEEGTVDKHIQNIYQKTECTKSTELSAWWFCKTFNISMELSPLKRTITAMALLLLLLPYEFTGNNALRVFRPGTLKEARVKRGDEDASHELNY